MDTFNVRNSYNSISGYLLVTLEGSIRHIAEFNNNKV